MAAYTLTIPDGQGARVVAAFCGTFGFDPASPPDDPENPGTPLTPNEFALQKIIDQVYGVVTEFEGKQAAATARQDVAAQVRATLQITRG